MNVGQFIQSQTPRLSAHPRSSRMLRQLIACRLNLNEAGLISRPDRELPEILHRQLIAEIDALTEGKPEAYVFGRTPFLDWEFVTDERALSPRPETEALCQLVREKAGARQSPKRILDLCCGSGVAGLSLALSFPEAAVTLTDLVPEALDLCRENRDLHELGSRTEIRQGHLWQALPHNARFDLVFANPPYVAWDDEVEDSVRRWEPEIALFSGDRGTAHIKEILKDLPAHLETDGLAAFELGHRHREIMGPWLAGQCRNLAWDWVEDPFGVARYLFCRLNPDQDGLIERNKHG